MWRQGPPPPTEGVASGKLYQSHCSLDSGEDWTGGTEWTRSACLQGRERRRKEQWQIISSSLRHMQMQELKYVHVLDQLACMSVLGGGVPVKPGNNTIKTLSASLNSHNHSMTHPVTKPQLCANNDYRPLSVHQSSKGCHGTWESCITAQMTHLPHSSVTAVCHGLHNQVCTQCFITCSKCWSFL